VTGAGVAPPLAVLVVDDDPRVRASLVHLLDEVGAVNAIAVDADQAWRLAAMGAAADVAVVDVPGGDGVGLRLVSHLASMMPVVAVGLRASVGKIARGAGAVAFVEKDGDADTLVATIRAAGPGRSHDNVPCSASLDDEG